MFFYGASETVIYTILATMGIVVFFIVYIMIPRPVKKI